MTRPDPSSEPSDADVETLAKGLHRACFDRTTWDEDIPGVRRLMRNRARALLTDPTLTAVFARAARPTHLCGHHDRVQGCGGCDPGAVEWVRDDDGPWRRPTEEEAHQEAPNE